MTRGVVDASALAAVVFGESGGEAVRERLRGGLVCAPFLLKFELANVAWKKARRRPGEASKIFAALHALLAEPCDIAWQDVDATDVALVAHAAGLSAYDASYVWLAGFLGAELITLDARLGELSRRAL